MLLPKACLSSIVLIIQRMFIFKGTSLINYLQNIVPHKLGDRNTKFFHTKTVIRQKRIKVHDLHLPNGALYNDDIILREEVLTFSQCLFPLHLIYSLLLLVTQPWLRSLLKKHNTLWPNRWRGEEVTYVLNKMHHFKTLDPDEFKDIFFNSFDI